jgi:excisionase family DNA binding protein
MPEDHDLPDRADADNGVPGGTERLMGTKEIAERLGVDRRTVRRYLRDGKIPSRENGREGRQVRESDLLRFVDARGADIGQAGEAGSADPTPARPPKPSETALAVRAVLEDLSVAVRTERDRADAALQKLAESEHARGRAEAELEAARGNAERLLSDRERLGNERDTLREQLDREREERLGLERAHARLMERFVEPKGFWARVFGR